MGERFNEHTEEQRQENWPTSYLLGRLERLEAESDYQTWILQAATELLTSEHANRVSDSETNISKDMDEDWYVILMQGARTTQRDVMELRLLKYQEKETGEILALIDPRSALPYRVTDGQGERLPVDELAGILETLREMALEIDPNA